MAAASGRLGGRASSPFAPRSPKLTPKEESSQEVLTAAHRALLAATQAKEAAETDVETPSHVRNLLTLVMKESAAVVQVAEEAATRATSTRRQSVREFAELLGQEAMEEAEKSVQVTIEYAERNLRKVKSLIEDHFLIDEAFRMLGPLQQDSNLARDVHDWFNLVALLPVNYFNVSNWYCLSTPLCGLVLGEYSLPKLWHGETFLVFWWITLAYFILDVLFIVILPHCVRSPAVIMQHHFVTIGYIFVPFLRPRYGWLMGACMIVEVNTWFLIARRSFNKKGEKPFTPGVPWTVSLRVSFISTCFYVSWFLIRLIFYPYLFVVIVREWWVYTKEVGTPINLIAVCPIMQCLFIFLNLKWTVDLIRSKLKGRGHSKGL